MAKSKNIKVTLPKTAAEALFKYLLTNMVVDRETTNIISDALVRAYVDKSTNPNLVPFSYDELDPQAVDKV